MGHSVRAEPWGVVDLDTDRGHVFVRQDWRYEWRNASNALSWAPRERAAYHKAVDRLIWRYWSFHTFVEVRKTTTAGSALAHLSAPGLTMSFDVRRVHVGGQWTVVVKKNGLEWSMPGWSVVGFLSDDGNYLVTGYPGVNILALDYKPDDVILSIRRRGHLIRAVRLNELLRDLRSLGPRSESGFSWGEYEGFVGPHRFALSTVERRRVVFDVETGAEVDSTPAGPSHLRPRKPRQH